MASTAVTALPSRDVIRDPVLVLPLVVAAGLAVGWLGVDEQVAGTRIAADVALAWALAAASLVVWSGRAGSERAGCSPPRRSPFWVQTSRGRVRTRCGRSGSCSRGYGRHSSLSSY